MNSRGNNSSSPNGILPSSVLSNPLVYLDNHPGRTSSCTSIVLFRLSVLLGVTRGSLSSLACQHTYLLSALLWASSYVLVGVCLVSFDERKGTGKREMIGEKERGNEEERKGKE